MGVIRLAHLTVGKSGLQVGCVIRGVVWAFLVTVILGIALSIILHFTELSESLIAGFSLLILFLSMLLGSSGGAMTAGSKGLLHGLSVCLVYFLATLLIGLIWNAGAITLFFIVKRLLLALVSGVLGGIIGIGLSTR